MLDRTLAATIGMAVAIATVGLVSPAEATFPGRNGLIAYTAGNGDESRYRIKTVEPDGAKDRVLLKANDRFDGGPAGPRWSRDGKKLLFAQYHRSNDNGRALWYATAAGKQVTRIPLGLGRVDLQPGLESYDWAPDGRHIVFAAGGKVYTIAIDGTGRRRLGAGHRPTWSADGRYIVFERHSEGPPPSYDALSRIYIVKPNGSGLRRLTRSDVDASPTFSPDGRRVVYTRYDFSGLLEWRMVDVSGRRDHRVFSRPAADFPGFAYCPPQWTPDGKRLGAIRTHDGPTDNDPHTAAFVTTRLDGSDERVSFDFPMRFVQRYSMCDFSWQPR